MTRTDPYLGFGGHAAEFVSDSTPWWPEPQRPHSDAPNVVIFLVDDLGFSDLGPFGSEIPTPHISELADDGWVFTNYRTAPLCSPARAALLTGLNPHRAGFGFVAHADPGFPGFTCELPKNAPTLAESLRHHGYATFMVGKWHLTLESRLHDGADRSSWPLQRGFDRYFGSMDGFTSLHHPHRLVRDNSVVDVQEFPDEYFLTDQLTDEALAMLDELRVNDTKRPFFLYYAHTSVHGPIQAKRADIERFRGCYASGWNKIREARFRRQQEMGIVESHAVLAQDEKVPEWDELEPAEKQLFERHMEAYAAAVTEIDESVGRVTTRLKELGEFDNTIIIIASDNGGSAEGGPGGTRSYFAQFAVNAELPDGWVKDVPLPPEEIGGPRVFNQYPEGWAHVSNTPFRSYKQSTYEGGVHAPLILSWPNAPASERGIRDQFVFVSDLTPTVLDLVGVSPPSEWAGAPSETPDGGSVVAALTDAAASGRSEQYFECVGRRALIDGDWKLVSPVPPEKAHGGSGGVWELYDLRQDPTESNDCAAQYPQLTRELAERWRDLAWANGVFPLDDDGSLRTNRPETEDALSQPVTIPAFSPPLERFRASKLTTLRSFEVEMDLVLTDSTQGVVVAHGDQGGGYVFSFDAGRPRLGYNAYGEMHRAWAEPLGAGNVSLRLSVAELTGLRCRMTVFAGEQEIASLDNLPMLLGMAPFTGISVGYDYGGPVDWELYERYRSNRFSDGEIQCVRYVPGPLSTADRTVLHRVGRAVAELAD